MCILVYKPVYCAVRLLVPGEAQLTVLTLTVYAVNRIFEYVLRAIGICAHHTV